MARPRKKGPREPNGRPQRNQADLGTPELRNHAVLVPRETRVAGQKGVSNASECLLDALHRAGHLGKGQRGDDRYSAGIWLRGLHERAMVQGTTASYEPPSDPTEEISEAKSNAFGFYIKITRKLGHYEPVLQSLCCYGMCSTSRLDFINEALDRLNHLRLDNT